MTLRRTATVRAALALLAAGAGLALGLGGASPAGAHEGAGIVTVEATHPAGTEVHYVVRVTWDNDGHPAADATVTATPVRPDGTALTPVTLNPSGTGDGRYSGVVEFPSTGPFTVRFTSVEPTGTAERTEQVTTPSLEPAPGEPTVTAGTEPDFAPADDGTEGAQTTAASDSGDGDFPVLLVVAAAVFALGGLVTAVFVVRRYRPDLRAGTAAGEAAAGAEAESGSVESVEGEPAEGDGESAQGDGEPARTGGEATNGADARRGAATEG